MEMCDLMPQDWVRNDLGEIQQVVELRESGVMLAYNDFYSYDEIEPVPITADILQKNGFEKSDEYFGLLTDKGERWVWRKKDEHYYCLIQVVFLFEPIIDNSVLVGIDVISKETVGTNELRSHDISFVHELQHALKACGAKKEFVLGDGLNTVRHAVRRIVAARRLMRPAVTTATVHGARVTVSTIILSVRTRPWKR